MEGRLFRANADWLGELYASQEYTKIERDWVTGFVNADGSIDPDPQVGLDSNHIWLHKNNGRSATRALLGDRMIPYRRMSRQACSAGVNRKNEFTAIAPIPGDAPGADAESIAHASDQSHYFDSSTLTMGLVTAWKTGGYGLFVFVHPLPYRDRVITGAVDVSASVPANPGEKRLVVVAYDADDDALVAVDGAVTTMLPDFTLEDVVAIDLVETDRIRLFGVVLEYGQTDITPATRFIDARDWLTLGGIQSIVAGSNITVDATDPANPIVSASGSGFAPPYIFLRDEQTSGTGGGTPSATTWNVRVLNTEVLDAGGHCTRSSNQFTLAAGTYRFQAIAPVYANVGLTRLRLYNVSDAAVEALGMSTYNPLVTVQMLHMNGEFTIAGTKTFELQHYTELNGGGGGEVLGVATSLGTEYYAQIELWKTS